MLKLTLETVKHSELDRKNFESLRRFFDAEYLQTHGPWNPEQPYGYAPHELHIMALLEDEVVGHVGWARRRILVGNNEVVIAGVGGVLINANIRGKGLGAQVMRAATESMAAAGGIEFGYLGCAESVVPYYERCKWHRIEAAERSIGRNGQHCEDPPGQPLLIFPIINEVSHWPEGQIDLRGRAW